MKGQSVKQLQNNLKRKKVTVTKLKKELGAAERDTKALEKSLVTAKKQEEAAKAAKAKSKAKAKPKSKAKAKKKKRR